MVVPAANARRGLARRGARGRRGVLARGVAASSAARGARPRSFDRRARPTIRPPTAPSIWPTSAGRRRRAARSRSRRRAVTTCVSSGSPGAGKTMLARRLPTILPEMSREEALEVTQLHSVAGILPRRAASSERGRSAHRITRSRIAGLLGGGSGALRPGEVSLAHHGVLFLDELTEFRRDALEGLRQPLEDGRVVVTRVVGFGRRSPRASRSSPRRTRVRAGTSATRGARARAAPTGPRSIARSCRGRCSTGSTCVCTSRG